VGEGGHGYVVGAGGRLIAHPDISLVLRNTDMSKLVQGQAAQAGHTDIDFESLQGSKNIQGQEGLTASAPIQARRSGAERIGSGDFDQLISIPTGDELEGLANQFNDMGARLQESYA